MHDQLIYWCFTIIAMLIVVVLFLFNEVAKLRADADILKDRIDRMRGYHPYVNDLKN